MAKEHTKDLTKFLKPFPRQVQEAVWWLREFVWDLYPQANELIYDNYNALAFGWSVTERQGHVFCSIAAGRTSHNVHFGFYYGAQLSDPEKILIGKGNQYRYILVKDKKAFPRSYMMRLLKEAYSNSRSKVKDDSEIRQGLTITKSISPVKRTLKSKRLATVTKARIRSKRR